MQSHNTPVCVSPANPQDAAELTRIAHAAKSHWGYPGRWMALWRDQLTVQPDEIAGQPTFTARSNGHIVGWIALRMAPYGSGRSPDRAGNDGLATVEHLWVLPDAMGRGVGRALFEYAAGYARQNGAAALEVESDPNATGFYRRLGCRPAGEHVYELDGQPRSLPVLRLALETAEVAAR